MTPTTDIIGLGVTAVFLLGSLIAVYRKRGTISLKMLNSRQWGLIQTLIDQFRATFFSVEYERRHIEVFVSLEEVRVALLKEHFVEWDLAYYYEGERLNMRRGCYISDSHYPLQQDHVRGFVDDGQVRLAVHRETRPEAHPDAHLDNHHLRHPDAIDAVCDVLDASGIRYRRLD